MTWWVTWPYTAGLEHISTSVDGRPRSFTLRATQVYRREGRRVEGRASARRHRGRVTPPLLRAVADDDIESAWGEVFDALPARWAVGRPSYYPERREWQQYAFDSFEMPKVCVRSKE